MGWRRIPAAIVVGLILALLGMPSSTRAQCPMPSNLPPLRIAIRVPEPQINYHHDVDLFGLPKLEHHSERPPPGWTILGLTKIADQLYMTFRWATVTLRDGRVCVWLTDVDAQLGDSVMNVYVAADYAPNTCEYNVILAHENTHVRFNVETLRDWMPSVKAALSEAARRKFPAIFAVPPSVEELRHYLIDNMSSVFELMNQDMAKRNATIDTPENYRRENAKCHNWSRNGMKLDGN